MMTISKTIDYDIGNDEVGGPIPLGGTMFISALACFHNVDEKLYACSILVFVLRHLLMNLSLISVGLIR